MNPPPPIISVDKQIMGEANPNDFNPDPDNYDFFKQTRNRIYYKRKGVSETDADAELAQKI